MRLLLLDNFDSFTYNLLDYFRQLGCEVIVRRNDVPLPVLEELAFDGIVLSPGPGVPREAGVLLPVIEAWHQRVPMLGVCLGHQALGEFFGAELRRGARPMHGKVSEIEWTQPDVLWQGLPARMPVARYHSLILQQLPATFDVLARTTDVQQEIMAFRHQQLPLYGVQFHPEALLTPHGLALLGNWVKSCIIAQTGPATASSNSHP
ncbi:aminodeoxychorismate/anthranilate synthase component II [Hymenobacter taeanensis]|uniref:Aminodeoxychorismate/anthranilate synthase component II n=1 Tax=Hymenobacter taeanensis TaxID=2735321 RepID=A0A6M6BGL1_9BACT|nr:MULTISPECIES: aminodeoxychorismate/anthranilate synthase component II [Hymenobacter]QJX47132.1 aminodeoxychorismate/anthranilate synthase component II [Hymenobacter taeanensis]UOQ81047.1 aminodeoxychorismate/anthranilate synthase component II [Hymenobacter sp. 5414T-23]